jgi:hypothetical protein
MESLPSQRNGDHQNDRNTPRKARRNGNTQALTTVELVPIEVDDNVDTIIPVKRFNRKRFITTATGDTVELDLKDNSELLSVEENSARTLFLVSQGSLSLFSVYNEKGELVTELPTVANALPDLNPRTQFNWNWVSDDSLIATLGFIHEVLPNQYPEKPTDVYELRLYSYDIDSQLLRELHIPKAMRSNGVLRLDGVSASGLIKLSSVPLGEDYNDTTDARQLGFFKIPD